VTVDHRRIASFIAALAIVSAAIFVLHPAAIAQDPAYHSFTDQRELLPGVPNTLNVLSNAGFALVGIAWLFLRARHAESAAEVAFFAGAFATAAGSAYYHLHPDNARLVFDRLGMSIAFMALLALIVRDRLTPRWNAEILFGLECFGIGSVLLWKWTGDLRLYGVTQFFPLLAMPVLLLAFPGRLNNGRWLWVSAAAYVAAKPFEFFDPMIAGIVSGHTIKHLLAALSMGCVLEWLRQPSEASTTRP
jgi:hypothetical protein